MRNRHLTQIAIACLGIFTILSLHGSPRTAGVLALVDPAHNPVSTVQEFYKAVERGDWLKVRSLTTDNCWTQLEHDGQITVWVQSSRQDKSLEFVGFSIQGSRLESKKAVIDGRPVWVSVQGMVPRITQTITLFEASGGWRIDNIQNSESSPVVEEFYAYLSQGRWNSAKSLVLPETWNALQQEGILGKVKRGFVKIPYVTIQIMKISEKTDVSEVQAELIWYTSRELKLPVTVKLVKMNNQWIIQDFSGGWPQ